MNKWTGKQKERKGRRVKGGKGKGVKYLSNIKIRLRIRNKMLSYRYL